MCALTKKEMVRRIAAELDVDQVLTKKVVQRTLDMILEADRNVKVIEKIAEYGIAEPSSTLLYVEIAECAEKAPVADDEFIELAELVKKTGRGDLRFFARQASYARNERELDDVMQKIEEWKKNCKSFATDL